MVEYRRDGYSITTEKARLDVGLIHECLSQYTYWAEGRPLEIVRQSIEGSPCFGVYKGAEQVGFARAVTDRATCAWLCDVFVVEAHRGLGLDLLEIVPSLLHRWEWRGSQATTDGRIVDLESKEFRDEGEVLATHWTTFAFSGTGGLVYHKTKIDQSTFRRLRRGDPVKVRYAKENPRLAILERELNWWAGT